MPVNLPNPGLYYGQLGQHLIALQTAIDNLVQDATYLNAMGGTAFLEAAPFSLDANDAQLIVGTVGAVTADNTVVQQIQAFLLSAIQLTGGNVS
jgi:hypothetical protein